MQRIGSERWVSAAEIATEFLVRPETLELYSRRGSLSSFVDESGERWFQASAVASIFRRRAAHAAGVPSSLGELGTVVLGAEQCRSAPPRAGRVVVRCRRLYTQPLGAEGAEVLADVKRYAV